MYGRVAFGVLVLALTLAGAVGIAGTAAGGGGFNVASAASVDSTTMTVTFDAVPNFSQAATLSNYSVPGLALTGTPVLSGSTVTITTSRQAAQTHTVTVTGVTRASDAAPLILNRASFTPDGTPPIVTCGTADGVWHPGNVTIACTAADSGSSLQNGADASVTLTTNVAAGDETADAQTDTRTVCDIFDSCTTAGPIRGNEIDRKAPRTTIASPIATTYLLGASIVPAYSCADGGSGIATCTSGSVDTATVGPKTFSVSATDHVGNSASSSVGYGVAYGVDSLFDPSKPFGGKARIELALTDANAADVSAASVEIDAVTLDAQPFTHVFEFRPELDNGAGGYRLDLSTKGLSAGTHALAFTAAGDPVTHTVTFTTR